MSDRRTYLTPIQRLAMDDRSVGADDAAPATESELLGMVVDLLEHAKFMDERVRELEAALTQGSEEMAWSVTTGGSVSEQAVAIRAEWERRAKWKLGEATDG